MDVTLTSVDLASPRPLSDPLVARLQAADATAIAEIYARHHVEVRAFGRRLLGDMQAAEDLVHEVFVELPRAIRRFEGRSSLRTFLLSIAVNQARHLFRSKKRGRKAVELLASQPQAPGADPEVVAMRTQLAQQLLDALEELPLDQRAAIVLCEVEERTSVEVSQILGVPEATVRTRLFHAKRKLRELLQKRGVR